jgi:hypothetical protein
MWDEFANFEVAGKKSVHQGPDIIEYINTIYIQSYWN